MATEIQTYHRMLDDRFKEVDELLDGLPTEALAWKPFEVSPWKGASGRLGWLIAHAISSTVYLVRQGEWVAGKREWADVDGDEGRDEYGPANHDPSYMRERARRAQALVRAAIDAFSEADLAAERPHPRRPDRIVTARFCLQHAYEHMSQHIGHAQLTRQLWAVQNAAA